MNPNPKSQNADPTDPDPLSSGYSCTIKCVHYVHINYTIGKLIIKYVSYVYQGAS